MLETRQSLPRIRDRGHLEIRDRDAVAFAALRDHATPRIDNQRVAVRSTTAVMKAHWAGANTYA